MLGLTYKISLIVSSKSSHNRNICFALYFQLSLTVHNRLLTLCLRIDILVIHLVERFLLVV